MSLTFTIPELRRIAKIANLSGPAWGILILDEYDPSPLVETYKDILSYKLEDKDKNKNKSLLSCRWLPNPKKRTLPRSINSYVFRKKQISLRAREVFRMPFEAQETGE